jgi:hypothetical protein
MEDALILASSRAGLPSAGKPVHATLRAPERSSARRYPGSESRYRVTFEGMGRRHEEDPILCAATTMTATSVVEILEKTS